MRSNFWRIWIVLSDWLKFDSVATISCKNMEKHCIINARKAIRSRELGPRLFSSNDLPYATNKCWPRSGYRCHKILGPPCDWGPPGPILPEGWGPRRELGAPHTFLTDSSVRLRDGRSVSVCLCLSVSSAIKQVPNMPNHQCIMEETEKESRFTSCDIFA